MTERQSLFLQQIIESYSQSAEPVASGYLAKHSNVSSATIRNDMAVLEDEGYIVQPHTSAGRIPSVKGYQYYLEHFFKPKSPTSKQQKDLVSSLDKDRPVKELAKQLSEMSNQAVLVAFSKSDYYYTGISRLFAQPEFNKPELVVSLSSVLDALDQTLDAIYEYASTETQVLVGDQNPFSAQCSLLIHSVDVSDEDGLIAVLGPNRMDYNRITGLLNFSASLLNK